MLDPTTRVQHQGQMRANYKMQRLYVPVDLAKGTAFDLDRRQSHYLANVLRLREGADILLFNGRDGEWRAALSAVGKKAVTLSAVAQVRPQPDAPDLVYAFAPIKAGRLDYLVQKAVEMGAGLLRPVLTHHTQLSTVGADRLRSNVIEAAEQCGVLAVPDVIEPVKLDALLSAWEPDRRLIFCDEDASTNNPVPALRSLRDSKLGLLVGPEGGFSDDERRQLRALPFVAAIPLGPRILRADTAAVAALAIIQATIGDWR